MSHVHSHPLSQHPQNSFPPLPSVISTVYWHSTHVTIDESMLFPDFSLKSAPHTGISPLYFRTTVSVSLGNVSRPLLQDTKVHEYGCLRPLYSMMQYFHTTYIHIPIHIYFMSSLVYCQYPWNINTMQSMLKYYLENNENVQ